MALSRLAENALKLVCHKCQTCVCVCVARRRVDVAPRAAGGAEEAGGGLRGAPAGPQQREGTAVLLQAGEGQGNQGLQKKLGTLKQQVHTRITRTHARTEDGKTPFNININ